MVFFAPCIVRSISKKNHSVQENEHVICADSEQMFGF